MIELYLFSSNSFPKILYKISTLRYLSLPEFKTILQLCIKIYRIQLNITFQLLLNNSRISSQLCCRQSSLPWFHLQIKKRKWIKMNSLLKCFRNTEFIPKLKMKSNITRLLKVKSLGLELKMQRKFTSNTKMIKERFMEPGSKGQSLLRRNQNSLRIKSHSSILILLKSFSRWLIRKQKRR